MILAFKNRGLLYYKADFRLGIISSYNKGLFSRID